MRATGQPSDDDDLSLPIRSPEHAAAEAARDDIRVFVIFWDEYHIAQMRPTIEGREALTDFVRNAFGPTDLVALMDPLTPLDAIRFTRDRQALADKVHTLQGRLGVYLPPRSPMEEAQMQMARDVEVVRSQVTASALEGTVLFLRSHQGRTQGDPVRQPGHRAARRRRGQRHERAVLAGWTRSSSSPTTATPRSTRSIRAASVPGRRTCCGRSLKTPAAGCFRATHRRRRCDRSSRKRARSTCSDTRRPKYPADGKFHRIKVRVKRPGVDVRARTGYFAPTLAELESARKATSPRSCPPEISHAVSVLAPRPDAAGDLWAGASRGPTGAPRVTVSWMPQDATHPPQVSVVATGADGKVYFDGPLTERHDSVRRSTRGVEGSPDRARRRRRAEGSRGDLDGGAGLRVGRAGHWLPGVLQAPATVSSCGSCTPRLTPRHTPGTDFERTDHLLVRFSIVGSAAEGATITANLLSRRGASLATLPFAPIAGQNGLYEIDLPIGSIARGEYLIAIDASHGADHARTLVSFRAV